MAEPSRVVVAEDPTTLVELVNRVVDRGVLLRGEVTISVADVDLLYVGLELLLCSMDRLETGRPEADAPRRRPRLPSAEGDGP